MADDGPVEAGASGARGWNNLNRRELLYLTGAAGAVLYLERGAVFGTEARSGGAPQARPSSFTQTVRRRSDFLFLKFTFVNLTVKKGKPPKLVRVNSAKAAYVVVGFTPQHVAEQAYLLTAASKTTEKPDTPGNSRARLAFPSRLVFEVPKGKSITFDIDHLLDWTALKPSLAPGATLTGKRSAKSASKLREPHSTETALELPWRLALSPTKAGEWAHEAQPHDPSGTGWFEIWHTRLGHQVPAILAQKAAGTGPTTTPPTTPGPLTTVRVEGGALRAIWAYDPSGFKLDNKPTAAPKPATPFRTSLNVNDRTQIVRASSDTRVVGRADVAANRLWLSSLGGTLDARGFWELKDTNLSIEEWRHVATLGRDHYVKVVKKGFLYPFGHKAVQTTITERRFEKVGSSKVVGVMRQRIYLTVREPVKSYATGQTFGIVNDSRDLPFRAIRFTTLVSPDLDDPDSFAPGSFIPKVNKLPFRFHMIGTDWVGRDAEFTATAVFVDSGTAFKEGGESAAVRTAYDNLPAESDVRQGIFTGQTVALAESVSLGDTDVELKTIVFGARAGAAGSDQDYLDHDQPRCYPTLAEASVRFGAAEQVSGGKPLGTVPVVEYDGAFVDNGFNKPQTAGNLFVRVQPASTPFLDFGSGSSGGVLTPNIAIGGLSRSLGTVGGNPDSVRDGHFDPKVFFGGIAAKILGGVDLFDLVLGDTLSGDAAPSTTMKLTYRTTSEAIETSLVWKPNIKDDNPVIRKDGPFKFEIDAKIRTDLQDPTRSTYDVLGDLRGFQVSLIGFDAPTQFVLIHFNALTFTAKTGQSTDIKVDIAKVEFKGVLEFVDKLKDELGFNKEGGPSIDVTPTGINASLSVPIPSIQVGVFGLSNIAINAAFNLPFTGEPARFRFGLSTREDKFALQISFFGGGGFFGIAIGTDGVEQIEAALEFGAMASIDIGVASGSVHLLAGIYFSYGTDATHPDPTCVLTGYVRMGGELDVLGIISVSLEFYLGLTYQSGPPKKVYGQATLTVKVSVLCFSTSVELTTERQFGGEDGDPTFAQQIPATLPDGSHPWDDYCSAFVEI